MLVLALAFFLTISSCNLPTGFVQAPGQQVLVVTATSQPAQPVALEPPAVAAVTATECYAMVTATVNANIRKGPDTVYDIVGYLPQGGTAKLAGRNDANTWWYIEFVGGVGGYAWIAGSVTSATCIPATVQVVAAPPPPAVVAAPQEDSEPAEEEPVEEPAGPAAAPDLGISQFTLNPNPPTQGAGVTVSISVYNYGNAPSGGFTVKWWPGVNYPDAACSWNIASLVAHGGYVKTCVYPGYPSWYGSITTRASVDTGGSISESNEGNNISDMNIQVLQP